MHYKIAGHGDDTQTELILINPAGEICGRRHTIGCNPDIYLDQDTIRSILLEGLDALAAQAKTMDAKATIARTLLCLPGSPSFWTGIVARLYHFSPAISGPTYLPVLELATNGQPGLVVNCGRLNSFVAARGPDNTTHCARNFGSRLSDPASDFDLGRRALIRTLSELQGWAEPSELGRSICTAMKTNEPVLLAIKLDGPSVSPAQIVDLAPVVTTLAAQGDPAALAVLRDATSELLQIARNVQAKLFSNPASCIGPVVIGLRGAHLHTATAQEIAEQILGPDAKPALITADACEGMRRLLARTE